MSTTELVRVEPEATATTPESGLPMVSIIVPTYNRAHTLPFLFDALSRQVYPASQLELIVVDNSSDDDTEQVVAAWAEVLPFPVSFYRKQNNGPTASRNYGAARARGEFLAYTDSDCMPTPGWIRGAVAAFTPGVGIVCGPFLPLAREEDGLIAAQQAPVTSDIGNYPTANLVLRRSDFELVGGFDEQFGLYPWGELIAGEDADLAWRIKRTGARAVFRADLVVLHLATSISLRRFLLRPVVVQIIPRLLPRIPELRDSYLWRRYFLGPAHAWFHPAWIGVLTALLTGWWPPALLAVPYAWHHVFKRLLPCVRGEGLLKGSARFALLLYVQVACSLVLVAGSLRFRRLVI